MEAGVLQSIVQDQQFRTGGDSVTCAGGAVRTDPGGGDVGEQQRLVAHLRSGVSGCDAVGAADRAAIASEQEVHRMTLSDQALTQVERERGLPRASNGDVAATDHRDRRVPAGFGDTAGGRGSGQGGER